MFLRESEKMMSIGAASRASGVGVETIRFYERSGVTPPAPRTAAGRRVYDAAAVERLRLIRGCRALGFSLRDAAALSDAAPCAEVAALARARLAALRARIAELQALERRLNALVADCAPDRAACPAVAAIAAGHPPACPPARAPL